MCSHLGPVLEETTSTENDFSDHSCVVPRVFRFSFLFFFFINGVMFISVAFVDRFHFSTVCAL